MIEKLKSLNPDIKFYSIFDEEFTEFGRIITNIATDEIINVAKTIEKPEKASSYVPSEPKFEALAIAKEITDKVFGTLPTQIGYCWGHNTVMNATEWHTSSEVNIAVTDLVLILGRRCDIDKDGKIDSSKFKAFYVPKGYILEVYATSLHYCPCEVEDSGFGCVVGLPMDTNTCLPENSFEPLLFARNKWLIAHSEATELIADGAVIGVTGINYSIAYY